MTTHPPKVKSGVDFENEFFGNGVPVDSQPQRMSLEKAIIYSRRHQAVGWDLKNPPTPLSLALYEAVQKHLSASAAKHLLLYCAIGSPLDYHYKTDGFFEIPLGKNTYSIARFDLTTDPGRKVPHPDVFIIARDRIRDPNTGLPASYPISNVARHIAIRLLQNIAEEFFRRRG